MRLWTLAVAGAMAMTATSAWAVDQKSCSSGNVCASDPETLMRALKSHGYNPQLLQDDDGDPMILANTGDGINTFNVYFFGCVNHKQCDSVMFRTTADPSEKYTLALVNLWNDAERFTQGYIDQTGEFAIEYDLSTMGGGVSKGAFDDSVVRFTSNIGLLAQVIQQLESGKVPTGPAVR